MKSLLALFFVIFAGSTSSAVVYLPGTILSDLCADNYVVLPQDAGRVRMHINQICIASEVGKDGEGYKTSSYIMVIVDDNVGNEKAEYYKIINTKPLPSYMHNQERTVEMTLEYLDQKVGRVLTSKVIATYSLQEIYPNLLTIKGHSPTGHYIDARKFEMMFHPEMAQ